MAPMLTIGEVARTTGLPAKTIRYYEGIGLLSAPQRARSGYRQYDESAVERLRFIRRARSLGLPLRRLRALATTLNGGPRPELRPRLLLLVRDQLSAVQRQIAELEALRQQLEEVSRRIRTAARSDRTGTCRCLEISGRRSSVRNSSARRRGATEP